MLRDWNVCGKKGLGKGSAMEKSVEAKEKIGYRQVFTQKEYCKILFANFISRFGDSVDAIAFTWLVYDVTKSASWAAIMTACNMLPTILLQPFAGAAVERRNKKVIMIGADILRGLLVALVAFAYMSDRIYPWMLLAFTLLISSVEAFCMPASTAVIPKVLDKKYYEYGMSLNKVGSLAMQLVGTGAAGILIGCFGISAAILTDAATFFGAALIKLFLKIEEEKHAVAEHGIRTAWQNYLADLKGGFFYVKSKKVLLHLCILAFLINGMLVPVNAFQAPLVSDVLGQGGEMLSLIGIVVAVGSLVGSVCYPMISKKLRVDTLVFTMGLFLSAAISLLAAGGLVREYVVLVYVNTGVLSFIIGCSISLLSSMFGVQFMKSVEEEYLARADAICGAVSTAAMPLLSFVMSGIVKFVSVQELIALSGVFCAIIFIVMRVRNVHFSEE